MYNLSKVKKWRNNCREKLSPKGEYIKQGKKKIEK